MVEYIANKFSINNYSIVMQVDWRSFGKARKEASLSIQRFISKCLQRRYALCPSFWRWMQEFHAIDSNCNLKKSVGICFDPCERGKRLSIGIFRVRVTKEEIIQPTHFLFRFMFCTHRTYIVDNNFRQLKIYLLSQ